MTHRTLITKDDALAPLFGRLLTLRYKPGLNALTGSPNATLLLCQILYWWYKMGRARFYKFAAPCARAGPGQSWQEELGFSRWQFESARRQIARRIRAGASRREALRDRIVIYWQDKSKLTWYYVNESLLRRRLAQLETATREERNATQGVDVENQHCKVMWFSSSLYTEITMRNKTERNGHNPDKAQSVVAQNLWQAALDDLQLRMTADTFSAWLRPTRAIDLVDGTLRVAVGNSYIKDWLDHRLRSTIDRVLAQLSPPELGLRSPELGLRPPEPGLRPLPQGSLWDRRGLRADPSATEGLKVAFVVAPRLPADSITASRD